MADNPHGFGFVKHKLAVPLSATINPYYVPSSYNTALFIGDPVVKTGTANTAVVGSHGDPKPAGYLPEINRASAAGVVTGIMVGKESNVNNLVQKHNPASTEAVILVCDDPFVIWQAQEDSVGGNIAIASIGLNTEIVVDTAGNATTGISGAEIDSSAVNTTAGLAVKLLRMAPEQGASVPAANAEWYVMLNDHTEMPGVAGI